MTIQRDFTGFKQMNAAAIGASDLTKGMLAVECIPRDVSFDHALPQPWLDAFSKNSSYSYHFILGTTFMLYSEDRNLSGIPWSACKEVDAEIKRFNPVRGNDVIDVYDEDEEEEEFVITIREVHHRFVKVKAKNRDEAKEKVEQGLGERGESKYQYSFYIE